MVKYMSRIALRLFLPTLGPKQDKISKLLRNTNMHFHSTWQESTPKRHLITTVSSPSPQSWKSTLRSAASSSVSPFLCLCFHPSALSRALCQPTRQTISIVPTRCQAQHHGFHCSRSGGNFDPVFSSATTTTANILTNANRRNHHHQRILNHYHRNNMGCIPSRPSLHPSTHLSPSNKKHDPNDTNTSRRWEASNPFSESYQERKCKRMARGENRGEWDEFLGRGGRERGEEGGFRGGLKGIRGGGGMGREVRRWG